MSPRWYNDTWTYVGRLSVGAWRLTRVDMEHGGSWWLGYARDGFRGERTLHWVKVTLDDHKYWTCLGTATSRNSLDVFPDSIEFWTKWEAKKS